ncbi:MAG TPA: hypothetical protein VHB69_03985 [Mycobacteriales bacterium]|nr:hypothetical protein [Mycobacteriales bacterium]
MRASQREKRDHGAVAVLTAIVLAFAMLPALALGTGSYVRSSTATELQRAGDSGALAGAAQIPLGDTTFVSNYVNQITGNGLATTLNALGLNDPNAPDPLVQACKVATADATQPDNLGHAYATYDPATDCSAKYVPNDSVISQLTSCVAGLSPANLTGGLISLLNGLLGTLGLNGLDATLGSLLPALLDPGVQVTMKWHVNAPFDSIVGSSGDDQKSTSIARRRFKNVLVVPVVNVPGPGSPLTINADAVLQPLSQTVFKTLTNLESLLSGLANNILLRALAPGLNTCVGALQNLQGDLEDLIDPPSSGPDLTNLLTQAAESNTPVLALVEGTNIPFLDFVQVCIPNATNPLNAVVASATNLGCLVDAPGVFRASLRNS